MTNIIEQAKWEAFLNKAEGGEKMIICTKPTNSEENEKKDAINEWAENQATIILGLRADPSDKKSLKSDLIKNDIISSKFCTRRELEKLLKCQKVQIEHMHSEYRKNLYNEYKKGLSEYVLRDENTHKAFKNWCQQQQSNGEQPNYDDLIVDEH